jgi:hypothetical protein
MTQGSPQRCAKRQDIRRAADTQFTSFNVAPDLLHEIRVGGIGRQPPDRQPAPRPHDILAGYPGLVPTHPFSRQDHVAIGRVLCERAQQGDQREIVRAAASPPEVTSPAAAVHANGQCRPDRQALPARSGGNQHQRAAQRPTRATDDSPPRDAAFTVEADPGPSLPRVSLRLASAGAPTLRSRPRRTTALDAPDLGAELAGPRPAHPVACEPTRPACASRCITSRCITAATPPNVHNSVPEPVNPGAVARHPRRLEPHLADATAPGVKRPATVSTPGLISAVERLLRRARRAADAHLPLETREQPPCLQPPHLQRTRTLPRSAPRSCRTPVSQDACPIRSASARDSLASRHRLGSMTFLAGP